MCSKSIDWRSETREDTPPTECCGLSHFCSVCWFFCTESFLPSQAGKSLAFFQKSSQKSPFLTGQPVLVPPPQAHCGICHHAFHSLFLSSPTRPWALLGGWMKRGERRQREGMEDGKGEGGWSGDHCGHSESGVPLPYFSLHQAVNSTKLWWNTHILQLGSPAH